MGPSPERVSSLPRRILTSSISASVFRTIEDRLSEPLFMGVPLGACLNDSLQIEFVDGWGDWRLRAEWKNRARNLRYWLRPLQSFGNQPGIPSGRILVTWYQATAALRRTALADHPRTGPR